MDSDEEWFAAANDEFACFYASQPLTDFADFTDFQVASDFIVSSSEYGSPGGFYGNGLERAVSSPEEAESVAKELMEKFASQGIELTSGDGWFLTLADVVVAGDERVYAATRFGGGLELEQAEELGPILVEAVNSQ